MICANNSQDMFHQLAKFVITSSVQVVLPHLLLYPQWNQPHALMPGKLESLVAVPWDAIHQLRVPIKLDLSPANLLVQQVLQLLGLL